MRTGRDKAKFLSHGQTPLVLEWLQAALTEEDMEGLLGMGAPKDEYDSEASAIESRMPSSAKKSPLTYERITSIVSEVWNEQFGPLSESELGERRTAFESVAREILQRL